MPAFGLSKYKNKSSGERYGEVDYGSVLVRLCLI